MGQLDGLLQYGYEIQYVNQNYNFDMTIWKLYFNVLEFHCHKVQ